MCSNLPLPNIRKFLLNYFYFKHWCCSWLVIGVQRKCHPSKWKTTSFLLFFLSHLLARNFGNVQNSGNGFSWRFFTNSDLVTLDGILHMCTTKIVCNCCVQLSKVTSTGWINRLTRTLWSSSVGSAKSCTWGGTIPCTNTCWGVLNWK